MADAEASLPPPQKADGRYQARWRNLPENSISKLKLKQRFCTHSVCLKLFLGYGSQVLSAMGDHGKPGSENRRRLQHRIRLTNFKI